MSSEARTFQRRTTRSKTVNAASGFEPTSRRNRRVRAPQRRRRSVRHPRAMAQLPHPRFGWYVGVTMMAIVEIIEWPLAILMMVGHEIAHRAHSQALRDFAEGVEAGT
jgi:hypothetical protein